MRLYDSILYHFILCYIILFCFVSNQVTVFFILMTSNIARLLSVLLTFVGSFLSLVPTHHLSVSQRTIRSNSLHSQHSQTVKEPPKDDDLINNNYPTVPTNNNLPKQEEVDTGFNYKLLKDFRLQIIG